jgi:hypothetical protein
MRLGRPPNGYIKLLSCYTYILLHHIYFNLKVVFKIINFNMYMLGKNFI